MRCSRISCAPVRARGGLALLALVGLSLGTSCDDPQGPTPTPAPSFDARWQGGVLEFRLDAASDERGGLVLVATAFEFDPTTEVLRADVSLHNRSDRAVPGPESVIVFGFVPAGVAPVGATCGDPLPPGECAFDHRGTYGDDGVLSPGESSTAAVWRLQVPAGRSFAFRARLRQAQRVSGTIAGLVFDDQDGDGVRDAGEVGIAAARVRLQSASPAQTQSTDALGRYAFRASAPGIYSLDIESDAGWHPTTALPLQVAILRLPDGSLSSFTAGDIGLARDAVGSTVAVEGFAYSDLDRDGQRDAGEPGIAGVRVEGRACRRDDIVSDDDGDEFETRTDAFGHYVLRLPACGGPWEIRGGSVDNHDRTTPRSIVFVAPPAAGAALHADFGYAAEDPSSRYEVRGVVFRDDDGDGVRDVTEPPIAGVLVTARGVACAAPVFASDRTDERGRYELEGDDIACALPWLVQRQAVPGTTDTTPANVRLDAPPVLGSEFRVDFGVRVGP